MDLSGFFCFLSLILFVAGVFYFGREIINWYNFKIVWCEKCNTWQKMSRMSGQIVGWSCPRCNWINQQKNGACPTCGWYGKYENGVVSRRGPFRKVDRTPVTPFWGIQEVYWAYEVKLKCPKHGVFTACIPAYSYENHNQVHLDDFEDQYDENLYYDEQDRYDDDYHPTSLY
jgi:hypothetical protein